MIDQESVERAAERFKAPDGALERLIRRRDRKRRNQRITAGVAGIAVFVAAVWIVTSGAWFDDTQTPAVPGPTTAPTETGPSVTGPPPAGASAAPDSVTQKTCSDGARARLELTNLRLHSFPTETWLVRFEVHRSPVGHSWLISLRASSFPGGDLDFRGIRVASDSGDLAVQRDWTRIFGRVQAKAVDTQTGQVCRVGAYIE